MDEVKRIEDELKHLSIGAESTDNAASQSATENQATPLTQEGPVTLSECTLKGVAELLKSQKVKNIVFLCGAGISVSAGIPDFRTPGTGLYSQLEKYDLPEPEAVFALDFFRTNPKPFCLLSKELLRGNHKPTPTHYFMKLLHDKGMLGRIVTQNIDSLEHAAGIPSNKIFQIHGGFSQAFCISCRKQYPIEHWRGIIDSDGIPRCTESDCAGLIKPDIVFFGEGLNIPTLRRYDMEYIPSADLFFCMGTSMKVMPAGSLHRSTNKRCPRVLINRERVGHERTFQELFFQSGDSDEDDWKPVRFENHDSLTDVEWAKKVSQARISRDVYSPPFEFDSAKNKRDVFLEGDCDDIIFKLVQAAGWEKEFMDLLIEAKHQEALDRFTNFLQQ